MVPLFARAGAFVLLGAVAAVQHKQGTSHPPVHPKGESVMALEMVPAKYGLNTAIGGGKSLSGTGQATTCSTEAFRVEAPWQVRARFFWHHMPTSQAYG